MMKNPTKLIALLSGASLLSASLPLAGNAQTVATDPVGYVTLSAEAGVDAKYGISMEQPAKLATVVDSVLAGVISVSVDPSAATSGDYVQFTDGALNGQWFQVVSSDAASITVAEDLEAMGAVAADPIKVVPFWTLSLLIGDSFPVSTDVFAPVAQVLLNDVTATGENLPPVQNYAYHDGSSGFIAAGWYNVNNLGDTSVIGDTILAPNSFITVRNESGAQYDMVVAGSVPTDELSFTILADENGLVTNDNLIYNPYPSPIQLSLSALSDVVDVSPSVFAPVDQVIVYSDPTGINPSPDQNYAIHDGSSGFIAAGWFNVNNLGDTSDIGAITIPAGGAFLIRKSATSSEGQWVATIPYSL